MIWRIQPRSSFTPRRISWRSFKISYCSENQLIFQDREIETTLGISGTSIHSILHEHLTVKKISSRWIPHNLSIAQKSLVLIGWKKCSKNTIAELRNRSMTSWQVINRGFTRMSPKVNSSRLYGSFWFWFLAGKRIKRNKNIRKNYFFYTLHLND